MANYCCTLRTNYFHVKDQDKFLEMMKHVYGCEDSIEVFRGKDDNGDLVFGFGGYGCISGYAETDDDEEPDYDKFLVHLQECIAEDDAIIISEAGNEKLRYVVGCSTVITSKEVVYIDSKQIAIDTATKILGNPDWKTQCDY